MAAMLDSKYRDRTDWTIAEMIQQFLRCRKLCDQITPEHNGALQDY